MLSRRGLLTIGAASIAIMGAGSAAWWNTRSPTQAYAPWSSAGKSFGDPRIDALAYAILVPNPHNRQPWKVSLEDDLALTLYCDLERRLPVTDPFDRQITIGLGCFLEALRMAAANTGYAAEINTCPEGEAATGLDKRPIARVKFVKTQPQQDPLFDQLLLRHTHRGDFDINREITPATLHTLLANSAANGTIESGLRQTLRDQSWQAMQIELSAAEPAAENARLTRIGKQQIIANPDGLSMSGPLFELMNKVGFLTQQAMQDPNSAAMQSGLASIQARMATAMGYVWLPSENNSRAAQLNAGKQWLRLHLQTTKLGLMVQPLSQALQEFPQMAQSYQQLHNLLGVAAPGRIQMFARIGFADGVEPSPRWPLETIFLPS